MRKWARATLFAFVLAGVAAACMPRIEEPKVRVAGVRVRPDDGRVIGGHPVPGEVLHDRRLHLRLQHGAPVAAAVGDHPEGDVIGRPRVPVGLLVHGPLGVVPDGLEALDEVAGRDRLRPRRRCGRHLQLGEDEIAVGHASRAFRGERIIGQHFQPEAGDPLQGGLGGDRVGVTVGTRAAGEVGTIGELREGRD